MKKLLFSLLFAVSSLCLYGQSEPTNLITYNTASQRMVWSDVDNEYLFFDINPRHRESNMWQFMFNDNHTGSITMTNISTGTIYKFTIYQWEIRVNDDGINYLWIDCLQVVDSQRITILVNTYPNGKMVSTFMPDKQLCIFFDNLQE